MIWLDTLLALAVVMMLLSTMVSVIIETAQSLLNERSKGLERLVEEVYQKVVAPRLGNTQGWHEAEFVKHMTDTRWQPLGADGSAFAKWWHRFMRKLRRIDKEQSLTTLEFIERLADSPVGPMIVSKTRSTRNTAVSLDVVLEDLANKFESFGDDATRYFARRARMFSVLIGFVLVFAINFSTVDVIRTLVQSDATRTALLAEGDRIAENLRLQLEREAEAREAAGRPGAPGAEPAEFIEEADRRLEESLQELRKAQLPIGWSNAPWLNLAVAANLDAEASAWARFWEWFTVTGFLAWFASVFLGGLLVGLGGPFWFDTYRRLASLSQVTRSFQNEVKQVVPKHNDSAELDSRANRFLRIFETAMAASRAANLGGRLPLSQDGSPIKMKSSR